MIEAFLVYTLLTIVMFQINTKLKIKYYIKGGLGISSANILIVVGVLIFSLTIGTRYMVGIDYEGYLAEYNYIYNTGRGSLSGGARWEFLYNLLVETLAKNHFHYAVFFIITAALQIFFFYKAHFNRKMMFLLPLSTFFLFITYLGSMENVMRQFIAFMILFYALSFVGQRSFLKFTLCICLAYCFHKSVVIVFPFYFIIHRDLFKKPIFQYILIGISFILSSTLLAYLWNTFSSLFYSIGYAAYDIQEGKGTTELQSNTGLGNILSWIVAAVLIFYYPRLRDRYRENGFVIYYNMFFIGLLLRPVFGTFMVFSRINVYFYTFRFLILAFLCDYLLYQKNSKNLKVAYGLIFITLVLFYYEIATGAYKMSPFSFFWE